MDNPLLIIGNKNYSSWSLRGWLLLKQFDIAFEEHLIELFDASAMPTLNKYSVTGKVPVLISHRDTEVKICITDSLAIGLFADDYLTDLDIWSGLNVSELDLNNNSLKKQRALCQSIVSEMHSGFFAMRDEMPMNIRATVKIKPSSACLDDLTRIEDIFEHCLTGKDFSQPDNSYLFGRFTLADAFYAPVVLRLKTYADASGLSLRATTKHYMEVMLSNPQVQSWIKDALQETRRIDGDEAGEIVSLEGVLENEDL